MKESRKTNIKVGITVIVALLAFIWILGWAKRITLAGDSYTVRMKFNSVSGLENGDHITVNGVKKGKVTNITVEGGFVLVSGILPNDVKLKSDAKARVEMLDLMGGKKIEIFPGYNEDLFNLSTELEGKLATDIPGALQMIGNVENELKTIIVDLKGLLEKVSENISDEKLFVSLRNAISNFEQISIKLDKILVTNEKNITQFVKNSAEASGKLNTLLSENSATIKLTLQETEKLVSRLNELSEKLDSFLEQTQQQKNNLGKIIYDEKVYEDLQNSLNRLNEITELLLEQMKTGGIKVDTKVRLFE
ncbi:MAG: MCE family protein [Ignavibacteria bacterium]|nr:MCE family protein [Ignavibacteria bacterium]